MISSQAFEELVILPTLALRQTKEEINNSARNISVEFKLGNDSITGFLILDAFHLDFNQRMELISMFAESLNIFLGNKLSKDSSPLELSAPRLINLDREINFLDNNTWYRFSLVYEEISYPVVLEKRGYL